MRPKRGRNESQRPRVSAPADMSNPKRRGPQQSEGKLHPEKGREAETTGRSRGVTPKGPQTRVSGTCASVCGSPGFLVGLRAQGNSGLSPRRHQEPRGPSSQKARWGVHSDYPTATMPLPPPQKKNTQEKRPF